MSCNENPQPYHENPLKNTSVFIKMERAIFTVLAGGTGHVTAVCKLDTV